MAYALIAFSKVTLPAIAAGTIADDRRTGRMEELQTALFTAPQIYLAKALAAALPFLTLGGMLLLLLAGVVIGEYVPAREVARLALEGIGQVLLAAFVTVTCSARFASRWTAMVAAYVWLWLALPFGWLILLAPRDETLLNLLYRATHVKPSLGFATLCTVQAALTGAVCLAMFFLGVSRLHPHGWKGLVLGPFRKGRRVMRDT
jgi:ABC-type transport system involved in multi-copper enzyme maturation permease subunit